jgi:4-hydroxybutyrate CoA-transferase
MNWKEIYKSRCVDVDTAFKALKNAGKVVITPAAAQPVALMDGLARRIREIDSVTIAQLLPFLPAMPYLEEDIRPKVRFITSYLGGAIREYVNQGAGEYVPAFLKDWSELYGPVYRPDVVLTQVSPPDKHGYCNMGISIIYMESAIRCGKTIIAEVNENMPRVHGDGFVHVSRIDYFVENNFQVKELPRPQISKVEEAIGSHVAELVKDGDCLQLGIGAIPDAVLQFLKNKRGLGIHSEMFSDGVMDLVLEGAIDNRKKNLHPGKMISTFVMGTRAFYDFVDDNPCVLLVPGEYSNDPNIIGKNENMVSINSSVSVDLMGQAASESIGTQQFSGTGGQVDFIRGAALSAGGRAILAFPSTAGKADKLQSRIVPQLTLGTPVSTSRNDIDYVVTEYGIARLKYKSMRERAQELIAIAHPDFRPELAESLKKMKW